MATLIPAVNLGMIMADSIESGLQQKLTQAVALFILASASSQLLNFTVFGGVLIRNLKLYFKQRYQK